MFLEHLYDIYYIFSVCNVFADNFWYIRAYKKLMRNLTNTLTHV